MNTKEKVRRKAKFLKVSWKQESPENKQALGYTVLVLGAFVWWLIAFIY